MPVPRGAGPPPGRRGHPDLEATESHVGECRACQDTLAELSGGSGWWLRARSTLADTSAVVSAEAVEVFRKIPLAVPPEARPTIPGYEIADVLGRGGMGVVYAATQVRLGRTVAVKVLGGGRFVDPGARRRFLAEAAAVANSSTQTSSRSTTPARPAGVRTSRWSTSPAAASRRR